MDELLHNTLLYDFYGRLLTEKQRDIYQLYFCEDMSLGEIGAKYGITRQAVNFSLKQSRKSLDEFEATLGLVSQHKNTKFYLNAMEQALKQRDFDESNRILLELGKLI